MINTDCGCRTNCNGLSVVASVIIGIITSFLVYTGTVTVTAPFLWTLFGIAVVWLALMFAISALRGNCVENKCFCGGADIFTVGILGTIVASIVLLAVEFAVASVIGAIIKGALLMFFFMIVTSAVCAVKCLSSCGEE